MIFFDTTPKSIVYPDGANIEEANEKGRTSRKFILAVIVCSVLLAMGLVALLIVLVTPQVTKGGNNKSSVEYSGTTAAPSFLQIKIPPKPSYTYNYMHTEGTQIVDRRGQPIRLTGCNW